MKTRWMFSALLLALPVSAQQPANAAIDRIFAQWDKPDSPGCTAGAIQNGRLVYQRGYGMANLDYAIPNSPQMVYYVGSVSKQFTAAAIATLVLDGKISLDDPVSKYMPEVSHLPRMTVRQLVHHTGGLRDIYVLMALAGIRMQDVLTDADAISLIAGQQELNFKPGDESLYSNSGYFFLGQIVKRVTGKSLREYADERIFKPLGMNNTHFHDEPYHVFKNRVLSYEPHATEGFRISYLLNFDKIGAGGLYTTLGDLLLWDQNYYNNKLGNGFLELVHTRGLLNNGDTLSYAFGNTIGTYRGLKTVRHGGSLMGFKAELLRFPEQRFSAMVLCNLESINPSTLVNQMAEVFLGDKLKPVALPSPNPNQTQRPAALNPAPLIQNFDDYVGTYTSTELKTTYNVERRGEQLWLVGGLPRERVIAPQDKDVFRAGSYVVRFKRDDSGRVNGFTIDAGRVTNIRFSRSAPR
jgi:CubicO group peptidase (beta-lactamase class C family)